MKKSLFIISSIVFLQCQYALCQTVHHWKINNLDEIEGNAVTVYGDPQVVDIDTADSPFSVVLFDGVDDGIIVDANPLVGATEFTAEVVFHPVDNIPQEPRFVHFQQDDNNRVLIELRNFTAGEWYIDTFIKSGGVSNEPLIDENNIHATSEWHHAALIYSGGKMSHYVNGTLELEGDATYSKMSSGQVSLGMRMNNRNFLKGYIKEIRVTHKALDPSEFLINSSGEDTTSEDTTSIILDNKEKLFKGSMLYPNPGDGHFRLSLDNSQSASNVNLMVCDMTGKMVFEQKITDLHTGHDAISLDLTHLEKGMYTLLLKDESNQKNFRFLIQ